MTEVTNTDLAEVLAAYAGDSEGPLRIILLVAASRLREAPSVSDSAGWIEWGGGECPVHPDSTVEYKTRGGIQVFTDRAGDLPWLSDGRFPEWDIIRYRLSV